MRAALGAVGVGIAFSRFPLKSFSRDAIEKTPLLRPLRPKVLLEDGRLIPGHDAGRRDEKAGRGL